MITRDKTGKFIITPDRNNVRVFICIFFSDFNNFSGNGACTVICRVFKLWVTRAKEKIHIYKQSCIILFIISTQWALHWPEKSTLLRNGNKRIDNPWIKILKSVGAEAQDENTSTCSMQELFFSWVFFHECCDGFSQGWKSMCNTIVYMINRE